MTLWAFLFSKFKETMMAKSIRLNQTIRNNILINVMAAYAKNNPCPEEVTNPTYLLNKAIVEEYARRVEAIPEVAHLIKHNPSVINNTGYVRYRDTNGNIQAIYFTTLSRADNYFWENGKEVHKFYEQKQEMDITYIKHPEIYSGVAFDFSAPDWKPENVSEKFAKVYYYIKSVKSIYKERKKEIKEWTKKANAYEETVSEVLQGVNTTKQLLEVWPEVADFFPAGLLDPSGIALPPALVADIDILNAAIGK